MTGNTETWLHCAVARSDAALRLICFPHAGGSASFFRAWGGHLSDTEVRAVRYPGRAERIDEPPPSDLQRLGAEIAEALAPLDDRPLALFGHSMGAVVALETARTLEGQGFEVAHLFASGSRNAALPRTEESTDDDTDDSAVTAQLVGLGGTDSELAADPFFRELVLPYLRADGRMFRAYDNRSEPILRCPVTAIAGDADLDADRRPWSHLTQGDFCQRVVPGDHFYLIADPPYALLRKSLGMADPTGSGGGSHQRSAWVPIDHTEQPSGAQ